MNRKPGPPSRAEERRARLVEGLPDPQKILRGTLVTRYRRCGRAGCHCASPDSAGHGPAYYLMVTVRTGRTLQVYVPREHKRDVEIWIRNFRRTRKALEAISTLNRSLLREGKLFDTE